MCWVGQTMGLALENNSRCGKLWSFREDIAKEQLCFEYLNRACIHLLLLSGYLSIRCSYRINFEQEHVISPITRVLYRSQRPLLAKIYDFLLQQLTDQSVWISSFEAIRQTTTTLDHLVRKNSSDTIWIHDRSGVIVHKYSCIEGALHRQAGIQIGGTLSDETVRAAVSPYRGFPSSKAF